MMFHGIDMSTIKVVLFDLDDTLMNHRRAAKLAILDWVNRHGGLSLPEIDIVQLWAALEHKYFLAYERNELDFQQQRKQRMCEFTGKQLSDVEADLLFKDYAKAYCNSWQAFPDVEPAVQRILASGRKIGIVTNGDQHIQQDKLNRIKLGYLPLFAASKPEYIKPNPIAYLRACQVLGFAPKQVLMIGDSLANDVIAPRNAGLNALLLDRTRQYENAIFSLSELVFE